MKVGRLDLTKLVNERAAVPRRRYAVIENPPGLFLVNQKQLIMASEAEMEMYKREFPQLVVRWAEDEDKKEWGLTQALFEEQL